jgi:hypothetical protein
MNQQCHVYVFHFILVLDTFISDLRQSRWFSLGRPVSSTNTTNYYDIAATLVLSALRHVEHVTYKLNCLWSKG